MFNRAPNLIARCIVRLFAVSLYLGLSSLFTIGQTNDITLRQYSSAQGLSQTTVTTMHIDASGLLWAGTCNGLNLLRGNRLIRMDREKPFSIMLNDNTIRSISQDGPYVLLIGTEGGAYRYDIKNKHLTKKAVPELMLKDAMVKPFQAGKHLCYISRENKILIVDTASGRTRILHFTYNEGEKNYAVHQGKAYWISLKPCRLYCLNGFTGNITSIRLPELSHAEGPFYVSSSSPREVLIAYRNGILILNPADGKQRYYTLKSLGIPGGASTSPAVFALRSKDQSIWIGIREHGLFQLNTQLKVVSSYTDVYSNMGNSLFNLWSPTCCVIDASGNVFVGTDGHGIIKINPSIRKFRHIIPNDHRLGRVPDPFTTALYQDTTGTLFYSCLHAGLLVSQHDQIQKQIRYIQGRNDIIKRIHFIVPWAQKKLLVGTDRGLTFYNGGTHLIPLQTGLASMNFTHCCRLDHHRYLLGSEDGLFMLTDQRIHKINTEDINQITLLYPLDANNILVAERHDKLILMQLLPNKVTCKTVYAHDSKKQIKPVYVKAVKTPQRVYVGTTFGLLVFSTDLNLMDHITIKNGLADHCIYSLEVDQKGRVWMGTNQGLSMLETATGNILNFTIDDGLQSMEFNTGASFFGGNGDMFFGGVNGINVFRPDQFMVNQHLPTVILSDIRIHNQRLNPDSLLRESGIRFPHFNNNLTFTLFASEYTLPERNRIRVLLKGIDRDWINLQSGTEIRYPFLPPGHYTLMVAGSNGDGLWTDPKKLFTFTIEKPFWRQGWFFIMGMLLLAGVSVLGVHLYYRARLRRKRIEMEQKQAIEKVRSRIAGEMHDDIGAGLTRIALMTEQLIREPAIQSEPTRVMEKMARLGSTSKELINSLKEIVWMTNPAKDSLESLLIFIRKTLNEMTENSGLEPYCTFPTAIPSVEIMPEFRRRISLIVKECINNAVKHSKGDTLSVEFILHTPDMFELRVKDNGTGIPLHPESAGNGIRNLRDHAEACNLHLQIDAKPTGGTTVSISGSIQALSTETTEIQTNP